MEMKKMFKKRNTNICKHMQTYTNIYTGIKTVEVSVVMVMVLLLVVAAVVPPVPIEHPHP